MSKWSLPLGNVLVETKYLTRIPRTEPIWTLDIPCRILDIKKGFPIARKAFFYCDHDWSRTSTSVRTLPPQSSASTNSATWPIFNIPGKGTSKADAKILLLRILGNELPIFSEKVLLAISCRNSNVLPTANSFLSLQTDSSHSHYRHLTGLVGITFLTSPFQP